MEKHKIHLLFICTANVVRSPVAASLFEKSNKYEARSAGTSLSPDFPNATAVNQELIDWADEIIVMSEKEDHHATYLSTHFDLKDKKIKVLDIPNIYIVGIPEHQATLLQILKQKLAGYLDINK
ncbi:MAG: hypothetical protein A3A96_01005 [Candidatus Zambryskibacteria bacterium RIFCSPLOWO2_01_FULL_39_39]|uniref:Phosphotyrosine protein phosphatase I domain-containing protein n=1 Tax=Candidatus Zambryskibacteria bacterium RIFCSPLOWO2_01_FULL_39_39 TaxID=1802758 RepID=A0A1G2TYQ0_9BACT|nr:MAG: hypothetical protein UT00_C0009G0012 [Parcubacteria group bacterium GW2011_GWA1_38_7]OHA87550.1 MAG: hypothetical protein A2644_04375 [Candidatus Zambryskibacteria bacterium RIFCSPHIGHO2_01_FULL_39_63]OHA95078.1 MAG: hypothetical protein A3B88_03285 [Candidatus Zambryskibacteria bacterium RIFCSPHIGHO2_02_FULL_39_19]OHA98198.1 MAG: hypothetical protein A3F20_04095 [Candidatus Zambryskibacteria bacterium RIFCSPHIGHO2_12_FULL_39_21]OHB02436.1 MAG: hypothetical protein A3A96_01005 [Candidat